MFSLVFMKADLDPTVIIGTKLKEFNPPVGGSNFRKGEGEYLIIEADEYHKAFLDYSPFSALITNIDREHLDYYKNLAEIKKVFLKFIGNIQRNGILVVNKDNKNLFSLKDKIQKIANQNNLRVFWYGITFDDRLDTKCNKIRKILKVAGEHNISNAMAVYTLAKALGVKDNVIFSALSEYRGAWRRMEFRGQFKISNLKFKILVFDDYAHHPTEIKATLSAFRQKYPKSRIICVFQPHQEKRLKALFNEFSRAFDDANDLILLDFYKVKGRDELPQGVNSQKLAKAIQKRKSSPSVLYLKNHKNLRKVLRKIIHASCFMIHDSCIIVMMGAGDIYKMTDKLIK